MVPGPSSIGIPIVDEKKEEDEEQIDFLRRYNERKKQNERI